MRLSLLGTLVLWTASFAFVPVLIQFTHGQVSVLLLSLLLLTIWASRERHDAIAGVALACALIKPPYILPLLLVFLLHRRWRTLGFFVGTAAVLFLAPVPFLGFSVNLDYLRTLHLVGTWHGPAGWSPQMNNSFAGFIDLLLPSPYAVAVVTALRGATVLLLARFALRSEDIEVPLALGTIVALLISPHVLIYDYTLLLAPVAVAWRQVRRRTWWPVLLLGYAAIAVGQFVVHSTHLHFAVLAASAFGLWLLTSPEHKRKPAISWLPRRNAQREPLHASHTP